MGQKSNNSSRKSVDPPQQESGRMPLLLRMFLVFAKIGVTTFGGGYAMLPILQDEVVKKHGWATDEELMDYYAIGQCTPGIIAVNTATFIGYRYAGILGGVLTTVGVVLPSIIIITVIAAFITNFASLPVVIHAFNGIRACVCVLIFDSVVKLGKKSLKDYRCWIIFLCVLGCSLFTDLTPVLLVVLAGLAGFLVMPRKNESTIVGESWKETERDRNENKTDQTGGDRS
ncbi:MAG: chromate transporter [Bilifractor sp.]|jgi:chromate transporter